MAAMLWLLAAFTPFSLVSAVPVCTAAKRIAGLKIGIGTLSGNTALVNQIPFAPNITIILQVDGFPDVELCSGSQPCRDATVFYSHFLSKFEGTFVDNNVDTASVHGNYLTSVDHLTETPIVINGEILLRYDQACLAYRGFVRPDVGGSAIETLFRGGRIPVLDNARAR